MPGAAYGEVELLSNKVDFPVGERDLDLDRRVLTDEAGHQAREEASIEAGRHRQPNQATGLALALGYGLLRVSKRGESARHSIVIGAAGSGEPELTARPLEQTRTELFLQPSYSSTHGRFRQPECPGSDGEALRLHHLPKRAYEAQIHRCTTSNAEFAAPHVVRQLL